MAFTGELRAAASNPLLHHFDLAAGGRTRRQEGRLLKLVALADFLVIVLAVLVSWNVRMTVDVWSVDLLTEQPLHAALGPWISLIWVAMLAAFGAYSSRTFGSGTEEFRRVFLGSLIAAGAVGMLYFLLQSDVSRVFVLLTFVIGIPLLIAERYAVRKSLHSVRRRGRMLHSVVAVGGPGEVAELTEILNRERYVGYRICGACVPQGLAAGPDRLTVPYLGAVEDTRRVCEEIGADTVLVGGGAYSSSADLRRIAWDLEGSEIDLVVVPSLTDVAGPRIHMRPVAGLPLLHVEGPQADEAGGLSKRSFDLVGALFGLLLLTPVFLLVGLLIKLEDGGPVFYRQQRVGLNGQEFGCWKFRSMYVDAERREAELRAEANHEGALFKLERDPRVTRLGGFLRRYSVDELPQLINVVRGEMSLVGPRPQQAWEVETYTDAMRRRLLVRPGMTGLWQVSGRSSLPWSEAVRLDLYYVDNWSMMTDLIIIAKTTRAVLRSEGAY